METPTTTNNSLIKPYSDAYLGNNGGKPPIISGSSSKAVLEAKRKAKAEISSSLISSNSSHNNSNLHTPTIPPRKSKNRGSALNDYSGTTSGGGGNHVSHSSVSQFKHLIKPLQLNHLSQQQSRSSYTSLNTSQNSSNNNSAYSSSFRATRYKQASSSKKHSKLKVTQQSHSVDQQSYMGF